MPYFPLFMDLAGKSCLVVGGGAVAARKIRTLLDFGALVTVLDPKPSDPVRALSPLITLQEKNYADPAELTGTVLVIAATDKRELNQSLAKDAKAQGIPVNVVDDPALCTFFFPAIVRRGELVAGISTSGDCPRLAARLREQMEDIWPQNLGETLELLKIERQRLKTCTDITQMIQQLDMLMVKLGVGLLNSK